MRDYAREMGFAKNDIILPVAAYGMEDIRPEEIPKLSKKDALVEFRAAGDVATAEGVFKDGTQKEGMDCEKFNRYCAAKRRFDIACKALDEAHEREKA